MDYEFVTQNSFREPNRSDSDNILDEILNGEKENNDKNGNFDLNFKTVKVSNYSDISDFDDSDAILVEASQNAEIKEAEFKEQKTARFLAPLSESQLKNLKESAIPVNTRNKAKWAVRLFESWQKERSIEKPLLQMTNKELNNQLTSFVTELKTLKGNDYKPNSLYEIIVAIQHHLRSNGKFISLLDDSEFSDLRAILDAKMKELSKLGLGINKKQALVITEEQENIMWEKEILGSQSPQQLLDTMVYLIGLNFALRAGQEHRNLRVGENSQLFLKTSVVDGRRYLQYREDISKCAAGGLNSRKTVPKVVNAYENPECPERCIVSLYEKFINLRQMV
ncbi:zinc finger MYM-type protein 2-like isoform X2 [Saccostrea cucullata]|uniref:zinc finger MYM-type protein 2-like isoform X2 n=1 Tax=Saccostrea cuccullata TaxID=36930 RepID=UPI002ED51DE0